MASVSASSAPLPASSSSSALPQAQAPSSETLALRENVETFLRKSAEVWRECPPEETGLQATPEVLDEIIHCATAFHCNAAGGVDLIWLKKDMPREALLDSEIGYWRSQAGPAAKHEQSEMQQIWGVPEQVISHIHTTNDRKYIAHFLYAYIDFWCIILKHIIIWIACGFFYGYLCLVQPTVIVCESSKLYRIFREFGPVTLFQRPLDAQAFQAFLNGTLDLAALRRLLVVAITKREWDDIPLIGPDYIMIIGVPCIVQYGPLAHHLALLVPKFHPYSAYHVLSLRHELVDVDRCARAVAKIALRVVQGKGAPPIQNRRDWLLERKEEIMAACVQSGLHARMRQAKANLAEANLAFCGAKNRNAGARRAYEVDAASGSLGQAARQAIAIRAEGEAGSDERKSWTISQINTVREQIEDGICIGLLACPRKFVHGTEEHALWLLRDVTRAKDVLASATGFDSLPKNPVTPAERDARRKLQYAAGASVAELNTCAKLGVAGILELLAKKPGNNSLLQHHVCLHCKHTWLTKDPTSIGVHTCPVLRKDFLSSLKAQKLVQDVQAEVELDDEGGAEAGVPQPKAQYQRCAPMLVLPWPRGERISITSAFWEAKDDEPDTASKGKGDARTKDKGKGKARQKSDSEAVNQAEPADEHKVETVTRRPKVGAPPWMRAIDKQGRISNRATIRTKIKYAFTVTQLQGPSMPTAASIVDKSIKLSEDVLVQSVLQYVNANSQKLAKKTVKMLSDDAMGLPLLSHAKATPAENSAWLQKQLEAIVKADEPDCKKPEFTLADIRQAFEQRLALNEFEPYNYDFDTGVDLLLDTDDAGDDNDKEESVRKE